MWQAFKLLAKFKGLRGTKLDIFGYTEERQKERALITDYRDTILSLLTKLNADNVDQVIAIASLPEKIRGFGHVKEKAMQAYHVEKAALMRVPGKQQAA